MADPIPPVPMIAVVMTGRLRLGVRPQPGRPVTVRVGGLADLDQVAVRVADIAADLVLMLLWFRQKVSTPGAPLGIYRVNVRNPDVEEAADPVGVAGRLQDD